MDRLENCLLLRRDVHSSFDDYQFGLYQGPAPGSYVCSFFIKWLLTESTKFFKFRVIIFERSGSATFRNYSGQNIPPPINSDKEVNDRYKIQTDNNLTYVLLKHHFTVGLLRNVAGYGQLGSQRALGAHTALNADHIATYLRRLNPNLNNQPNH